MGEKEQSDFQCLCEQFDKKIGVLMKVIYGLMTLLLGGSIILLVTFGEVKAQTTENTRRVDYIWRDYMPTIFMSGIMKSYDIQTEAIVGALNGDRVKIKEVNEQYSEFRKEMLNTLQQMRGGNTGVTRGIPKKVAISPENEN
jgi:hypothetical protein